MASQKGYIYAELDITDERHFHDEYMPRVRPVLDAYGARFLVATDSPQVIEEGMVLALETYWPASDGWSAARIERMDSSTKLPAVQEPAKPATSNRKLRISASPCGV